MECRGHLETHTDIWFKKDKNLAPNDAPWMTESDSTEDPIGTACDEEGILTESAILGLAAIKVNNTNISTQTCKSIKEKRNKQNITAPLNNNLEKR